jgi:acetyltransferase-like isoleucine patch superfamily enzyme
VGRYSSIYYTVRTLASEHPAGDESLHGLFCASALRPATTGRPKSRLVIGNDVWMGHNVVVLPSVERIGDGAVIGAGSVVRANVPPYAVVTGNPARVVRYRFSDGKIKELMGSRWWLQTIDELSAGIVDLRQPLEASTPSVTSR